MAQGRARCCGQPISRRYPLMELTTGALFVLAEYLMAPGMPLLGGLIFVSVLLILAAIDAQTQLLPDRLTLPLLWAGLLFNLSDTFAPLAEAVIGAMVGYLSLWSVYWVFRLLTGKEALGYGDFKLLAALGAWLGWQPLPQTLLLASASGLVWTLLQRLVTRRSLEQPLAFGPWLALAGGGIFVEPGIKHPARAALSRATGGAGPVARVRRLCRNPGTFRLRILLVRRVGAVLAGSSGQTCLG